MNPARLMTQTATLHHIEQDGDVDEYNNATEGEPATSTVGCLLQQRTRSVQTVNGPISTEALVLFLPAGTDVDTLDYVTVGSRRYTIDGPPWEAFNPLKESESHIEAWVQRIA